MRIDWMSGSFDEQRKFRGHMYDRDPNLTCTKCNNKNPEYDSEFLFRQA